MKKSLLPLFVGMCTFASACGSFNTNALFVSQKEKKATDTLLDQAQYYYDQGEFEKGETLALEAFERNPNSEKAATLLAYLNLGLAGVDIFKLTSNIIDLSATSTATSTSTATTKPADSNKSATDTLGELSAITGMDDAEFLALTDSGAPVTTKVSAFTALPVYKPKTATDARAAMTNVVGHINKAIAYICPYVQESAKVVGEPRDQCAHTENPQVLSNAKVHFIWSFAHLTEAIAFNTVVFYKESGESPNLLRRAEALNGLQTNLTTYATAAVELATNVTDIFPVSDNDSMLTAIFNDFQGTINGFDAIVGLPASMRKQIDKAFTTLKAQRDAINQNLPAGQKSNTALKQQFTNQMKANMATQIDQLNSGGKLTGSNKTEVCNAYNQVAGYSSNAESDLAACKT